MKDNLSHLSRFGKLRYKARERNIYYFGGNRYKVLRRDHWRCQSCGINSREHKNRYGSNLSIDHIDGRGIQVPVALKNNHMSNLITLCYPCHTRSEHQRKPRFKNRKCLILGCGEKHFSLDMCRNHYRRERARKAGTWKVC